MIFAKRLIAATSPNSRTDFCNTPTTDLNFGLFSTLPGNPIQRHLMAALKYSWMQNDTYVRIIWGWYQTYIHPQLLAIYSVWGIVAVSVHGVFYSTIKGIYALDTISSLLSV